MRLASWHAKGSCAVLLSALLCVGCGDKEAKTTAKAEIDESRPDTVESVKADDPEANVNPEDGAGSEEQEADQPQVESADIQGKESAGNDNENETDGNETDGNETDGNETDGNETDGDETAGDKTAGDTDGQDATDDDSEDRVTPENQEQPQGPILEGPDENGPVGVSTDDAAPPDGPVIGGGEGGEAIVQEAASAPSVDAPGDLDDDNESKVELTSPENGTQLNEIVDDQKKKDDAPPTKKRDDGKKDGKKKQTKRPLKKLDPNKLENITFDDLKLEMKADTKFTEEMKTDRVRQLDGQLVSLKGFIYAGTIFQTKGIKQFQFVMNTRCKFGPGGEAWCVVNVELDKGVKTDFTTRPVTLEGRLKVDPFQGPDGNTWAVYSLQGRKVKR